MKFLKTTLFLVLVMLLLPFGIQAQEPTVTLEFTNASSAVEIAQKYLKALQAGDLSTMDAQLASDAMVYGLGGGLDSLTKAQHKEYYTNSTNRYTHSISQELFLPVKVTNNWNEGEWVLTWGTNTLKDKSSGKVIQVPFHTANLIANGKIVRMHYWYDLLNVRKNQGYEIKAPSN